MKVPASIREIYRNPTSLLSRYKDSGVKVVGYTCSYVPEELIMSAGLQPYRISNIGANMSTLTPRFVCPFASGILENMLRFENLFSGFVIAHTCDPMWRLYDILKKKTSKPLFLLRVPHNTDNKLSLHFFRKELIRFTQFLEENFEAEIDDNDLSRSIGQCNESRRLLKDIYLLNSNGRFKIEGVDRFQIVLASMWTPKPEYNAQLKALNFDNGETRGDVRIHVNGTAVYDLELMDVIQEYGGFVASDDLCTGSRYFWSNVEKGEDPLLALSHRYLRKTPCPSQSPLEERLEYINFMINKFKGEAVITYAGKFCDPILYDSVHIGDMLAKDGIPRMMIDYENATQEIGRIKTRVEAFIESLGG